MKPDDTLLVVPREPKLIELATVYMNSSDQDSANWEGSGRARVQLQKFQNSLRNTYFSPLYILIYKTSWEAFDSISWSDIVSWCYWFYSIVMHHSWCLRRISYFSFDIENNFWTIQDIALLIFNKIQNITFIYVRYF